MKTKTCPKVVTSEADGNQLSSKLLLVQNENWSREKKKTDFFVKSRYVRTYIRTWHNADIFFFVFHSLFKESKKKTQSSHPPAAIESRDVVFAYLISNLSLLCVAPYMLCIRACMQIAQYVNFFACGIKHDSHNLYGEQTSFRAIMYSYAAIVDCSPMN